MFSINILCFMSNFSFKGDTLYRLIPSMGIDLFIPRIVLWGDTISRDNGGPPRYQIQPAMLFSKIEIWKSCISMISIFECMVKLQFHVVLIVTVVLLAIYLLTIS